MAAKCLGLLLAFASALGGVFGTTNDTSSKRTVHESRSEILLQEWNQHHRLAEDVVVPVRIGLTQTNLHKGHDLLMEMSDPSSPSYGKHMTAEEVVDFYAPTNEIILTVTQWLVSAGVNHSRILLSANKQWLKFDAPIGELEDLLEAEYYLYQHHSTFETDVGTEQYSIPDHVREHVDYIMPGVLLRSRRNHGGLNKPKASPSASERKNLDKRQDDFSDCVFGNMTPRCIAAMYSITESKTAVPGNEMGIYADAGNFYNQSDFDTFTGKFAPRIPQGFGPKSLLSVNGASLNGSGVLNGPETALDVQVAAPIIYPQSFTVWQSLSKMEDLFLTDVRHKTHSVGFLDTWLDAIDGSYCSKKETGNNKGSYKVDSTESNTMWPRQEKCGLYRPTNVISISYGAAEASFTTKFMKRQCHEIMKLGKRGASIFAASHDFGVRAMAGPNLEMSCLGPAADIFVTNYPASCPYVTSVGATQLAFGADVLDVSAEEAWRDDVNVQPTRESPDGRQSSGGGFSNMWPTPKWQKAAAKKYLSAYPYDHKSYSTKNMEHLGRKGGVFNRNGRGVPDVSAFGAPDYCVVGSGGKDLRMGGTSMAAPLWAAIFTRINEERLLANKKPVGFVNRVLYKNPHLMRDITDGFNWGCKPNETGWQASYG